jgi:hypothetical protein
MIPPGAWLGLLGGGQLGRTFCMAAQSRATGQPRLICRGRPRAERRRPSRQRRLPRSAGPGGSRGARACGHDGIRERPRGGPRPPCPHRPRVSFRGERRDCAGPDPREGVLAPRLQRRPYSVLGARTRAARRCRAAAGIVKSARMGYDGARSRRGPRRRRRMGRWAACPVCSSKRPTRARVSVIVAHRAQRLDLARRREPASPRHTDVSIIPARARRWPPRRARSRRPSP